MATPLPSRTPVRTTAIAMVAAAAFVLAGCENMSERQSSTAKGAGVGAVAGAVISSATGGKAGTGAVVGGAVGAIAGNLWSRRMEQRKQQMEQATQGTGVDVTRTPDNQLKLNVPSDISFPVNSAVVQPSLRPVLDSFANSLKDDPNTHVKIVGHTDSSGSDAINNPLSLNRAQSVRDYLADRGVMSSRIEVLGRGAREPLADNTSDAGRAQNRRVEIFLREPSV